MTVALNTFGQIAAAVVDAVLAAILPTTVRITSGATEQAVVVMSAPVSDDTVVTLSSDDPGIASVPASVMVLDGQVSAEFDVVGGTVGTTTIRANYAAVEKTAAVVTMSFAPTYVPQITGSAEDLTPSGTGANLKPEPYSAEEQ